MQLDQLKRREVISLLGGAAAAWPLSARAQQAERMRRIGVLVPYVADDPEAQARMAAFQQGLAELGWTDGRNLRIDTRWGRRQKPNPRGRSLRNILLRPLRKANVTRVGYAMAPYWPLLNQICEPRRLRCGRPQRARKLVRDALARPASPRASTRW
jgi:hypothetical protein